MGLQDVENYKEKRLIVFCKHAIGLEKYKPIIDKLNKKYVVTEDEYKLICEESVKTGYMKTVIMPKSHNNIKIYSMKYILLNSGLSYLKIELEALSRSQLKKAIDWIKKNASIFKLILELFK